MTNIEVAHVATGLANVGKNKGGVGVSFNIFETSFCFINAHLNARPSHKRMLVGQPPPPSSCCFLLSGFLLPVSFHYLFRLRR